VSKAEVELQKKAKQILDKYLVWDVQGFCEGLEKEILSLAKEGEGQIAEERKWAKHWAHEATVLKRQIADLTKERDGLSLEVEALKTEKKDWENIAEHRWDAIQELEGRLAETKKHLEKFPTLTVMTLREDVQKWYEELKVLVGKEQCGVNTCQSCGVEIPESWDLCEVCKGREATP